MYGYMSVGVRFIKVWKYMEFSEDPIHHPQWSGSDGQACHSVRYLMHDYLAFSYKEFKRLTVVTTEKKEKLKGQYE